MKVYLAGPYASRERLRWRVVPLLEYHGHAVQAGWLMGSRTIDPGTVGASWGRPDSSVRSSAVGDFADIEDCDVLVMFTDQFIRQCWGLTFASGGGRFVEVGYALAKGKPVICVGEPENIFTRTLCHVAGDTRELVAKLALLATETPLPELG